MRRFLRAGAIATALAAGAIALPAGPAQAADTSFSCLIDSNFGDPCGPQVTVGAGQTLSVVLVSSGGKPVEFWAVDVDGNTHGDNPEINPGAVATQLWTNGTGNAMKIQVWADVDEWVDVTAKGRYIVK